MSEDGEKKINKKEFEEAFSCPFALFNFSCVEKSLKKKKEKEKMLNALVFHQNNCCVVYSKQFVIASPELMGIAEVDS